jgi:hypothetical protein
MKPSPKFTFQVTGFEIPAQNFKELTRWKIADQDLLKVLPPSKHGSYTYFAMLFYIGRYPIVLVTQLHE